MEIVSQAKYIHMSPRKIRLIASAIKSLTPKAALQQLAFMRKAAAAPIAKALQSALANAQNNGKVAEDTVRIKSIIVGQGSALKRWRPVSRGRAHAYKKRTSHIKVILEEYGTKG